MSLVEMFLNLKVSVGMCLQISVFRLFSQIVEAPKATVAFRASKKPITPVKGLILRRFRTLLYYRGASFKITKIKIGELSLKIRKTYKNKARSFWATPNSPGS